MGSIDVIPIKYETKQPAALPLPGPGKHFCDLT